VQREKGKMGGIGRGRRIEEGRKGAKGKRGARLRCRRWKRVVEVRGGGRGWRGGGGEKSGERRKWVGAEMSGDGWVE